MKIVCKLKKKNNEKELSQLKTLRNPVQCSKVKFEFITYAAIELLNEVISECNSFKIKERFYLHTL